VVADIAQQLCAGQDRIIGVMIESHLVGGRQELTRDTELVYGQSITDGCLGWDASTSALAVLADAVRQRRVRQSHVNYMAK
jgi:3-deoxy-7-phosphoheptulonate synthase